MNFLWWAQWRATRDIDFGIRVPDWDEFERLVQLLKDSNWHCPEQQQHRLVHESGIPVDLIPFGAIESDEGEICWPPYFNEALSVESDGTECNSSTVHRMMDNRKIQKLLAEYDTSFHGKDYRRKILLTSEWKNGFPAEAGVYVVFNGEEIVYVGETGSTRERMNGLRHTQNHTVRRSVGTRKFCDVPGYEKASSHKKYSPHIEEMVVDFLCKLEVTALPGLSWLLST